MQDYKQIAKDVLVLEAAEILSSAEKIGDEMTKAVELIANTKGKLIITGVEKVGL